MKTSYTSFDKGPTARGPSLRGPGCRHGSMVPLS